MLQIKHIFLMAFMISMLSAATAGQSERSGQFPVNEQRLSIEESKTVINEILKLDEFITTKNRTDWQFNFELDEQEDDTTNELWSNILLIMARGIEYMLWVAPVILILSVIYYAKFWRHYHKPAHEPIKNTVPDNLLGIDLDSNSLPENITASAMELWYKSENRKALSLLFRASIINIIKFYKIKLTAGLTEHEIVSAVNQIVDKELAGYFEYIARLWINVAYGHEILSDIEFKELCHSWDSHFDTGSPQ